MLDSIRAPAYLPRCVANLLSLWASQFKLGFGRNAVKVDLHYHRGLFQGDSLSPLLFCLSIMPLSHVLRSIDSYKSRSFGGRVTHLLFMDDLKVYARDDRAMKKHCHWSTRCLRRLEWSLFCGNAPWRIF